MLRWTFQGKETRRFFPNEAKAKSAARKEENRRLNLSASVAYVASDEFVRKAVELSQRLEPLDATLEDAVNAFIQRAEAEGRSITLGELRERYVESKRREGLRPLTLKEIESRSKVICEGLGEERKIASITPTEVARWLDGLEFPTGNREEQEMKAANAQTKNHYRRIAHAMMEFATRFHSLEKNPVSMVPKKRVDRDLPEIFTKAQIKALLKEATGKPNLVAWIALGAYAGLRASEVEKLDWTDISLQTNTITLRPAVTKSRQTRLVEIRPRLREILEPIQQAAGPVITARNFSTSTTLQRFRKNFSFQWPHNGLRHSFGTYHYAAFRNAGETAIQMGHRGSPQMLLTHYDRGSISKEEALEWWHETPQAIEPSTSRRQTG